MAAVDPISALLAQASPATAPVAGSASPSAAAVGAFQSAMDSPHGDSIGLGKSLFGSSARGVESAEIVGAPLLKIPENFEYLPGTIRTLESVLPTLPTLPSPVELLSAQMKISAIQLEWQFIAKATGTAVQGVQSLVNSQV
jgi:hypothetical protein